MKLDSLDSEDGNVVKTDDNGTLRFDVKVNKHISGISLLDLDIEEGAFAGLASLDGEFELEGDATLRLVLGKRSARCKDSSHCYSSLGR